MSVDEGRATLERKAWDGLRSLVLERYSRRREVSDALGMSFLKVRALRRLASHGTMSMRDLSATLSTDKAYATLVVDDLEERGLVVRETQPEDRRAKFVSLTPSGRAAARKAQRILDQPPAPLHRLSAHDLAELNRIVAMLTESADGEQRQD